MSGRKKKEKAIFFTALAAVALALAFVMPSAFVAVKSEQGQATIGGDFVLTGTDGVPMSLHKLPGEYRLVYFGFTHCPDICPTGLQLITEAMEALGDDADALTPVFITLDPARDDHIALADYMQAFDARIVAFTGSQTDIDKVAADYKVYHAKHVTDEATGEYVIDHSGFMYLTDAEGTYIAHYKHDTPLQTLVEGIHEHLN